MDIGPLDQQVRIEQQGSTMDAIYGPQPGAWTTLDTVWAGVRDVLPSRAIGNDEIRVTSRPARIRMRYRTDIDTTMRLVLIDRGNRVMKIVGGPAELGRRDGIELMVEEYTTSGDAA